MDLIKWNPFKEMEDVMDRYRRFGEHPFRMPGFDTAMTVADWSPRVDVAETDAEYTIKAELPEVNKDDVKVTLDHGMLTIQGERKQEKEEKGKRFHRVECSYGSFARSFRLPENIDEAAIVAEYKDGVLTLKLPKTATEKAKAREITIG